MQGPSQTPAASLETPIKPAFTNFDLSITASGLKHTSFSTFETLYWALNNFQSRLTELLSTADEEALKDSQSHLENINALRTELVMQLLWASHAQPISNTNHE